MSSGYSILAYGKSGKGMCSLKRQWEGRAASTSLPLPLVAYKLDYKPDYRPDYSPVATRAAGMA